GYDQGSGAAPSNGLPGQQTTGSVSSWPFGKSWLDGIQKSFKSREMLEASVIIHRIQRAPTRLAWFIDVGRTRGDKAMAALQRFRNELNQKRGQTLNQAGMDATNTVYNPISALEDYYIPVSIDQRGSKVEVLEGTPWNELPDLDYFNRKLSSGLRVPFAWLQPVQDQIVPANGRQDTATVEEVEFSRFVSRIQMMINDTLDKEFKRYLSMRGASFDPDSFIIRLNPPDDYARSKERAILNDSIETARAMLDIPFISRRTILKKALGWSDDEIAENEDRLREEMGQSRLPAAHQEDMAPAIMGPNEHGTMPEEFAEEPMEIGNLDMETEEEI
ncbi:MAG: hypothetical protein D6698_12790, partial [Gammaproteobacteria bacterium]